MKSQNSCTKGEIELSMIHKCCLIYKYKINKKLNHFCFYYNVIDCGRKTTMNLIENIKNQLSRVFINLIWFQRYVKMWLKMCSHSLFPDLNKLRTWGCFPIPLYFPHYFFGNMIVVTLSNHKTWHFTKVAK